LNIPHAKTTTGVPPSSSAAALERFFVRVVGLPAHPCPRVQTRCQQSLKGVSGDVVCLCPCASRHCQTRLRTVVSGVRRSFLKRRRCVTLKPTANSHHLTRRLLFWQYCDPVRFAFEPFSQHGCVRLFQKPFACDLLLLEATLPALPHTPHVPVPHSQGLVSEVVVPLLRYTVCANSKRNKTRLSLHPFPPRCAVCNNRFFSVFRQSSTAATVCLAF